MGKVFIGMKNLKAACLTILSVSEQITEENN